ALSDCSTTGAAAALFLYAVRSLIVLIYSRCYVKDGIFPRWLWLLPLRDALAFATWGLAFLGNRVRWRGHLFRLLPGGRIVELPEQV
ncbi:MAG TPA: ceramide glucosyltransferase, partial [Geobacteraceae bacterium]|nr:ceramide glucosyltransferase [Geobacteraceae bacterium]